MTPIIKIIKSADKKLARKLRLAYLESFAAKEEGILQEYRSSDNTYPGLSSLMVTERGAEKLPKEELYPDMSEKHSISQFDMPDGSPSLSTRYVPNKPGVMSQRVTGSSGVVMDPYTNKIYDWNEGFKTEDGRVFAPSSVSLQTDLYSHAEICHPDKIKK